MKFTLYKSINSTKADLNLELYQYTNLIKNGGAHDAPIFDARAKLESGDVEGYKAIKSKAQVITGSCTIKAGADGKGAENIDQLNGLMLLDIDEKDNQYIPYNELKNDPYTHIIHKSFSGKGYVIFCKTTCKQVDQYKDYYQALANYYFKKYGIISDKACKNPNRLRYISYDPDLHLNEKSQKWSEKWKPVKEKIQKNYYYTSSDNFDRLINEVNSAGVDLTQDDYQRYLSIGFALANEFQEGGREYFHALTHNSIKYDYEKADKQFTYCLKSHGQGVTIATVYYYMKEAGISIYDNRLKEIINTTNTAKKQGNLNPKIIAENIQLITGNEVTEAEQETIKDLLKSPTDFTASANEDLTDFEVIENYILRGYDLRYNEISKTVQLDGKDITDRDINTITADCKRQFKTVNTKDVDLVLGGTKIKTHNELKALLKDPLNETERDLINEVADCLETDNPEFTRKYFKKWLVSGLHNWTKEAKNPQVSPQTIVLVGQQHGTGKTSFFRNLLPERLKPYIAEEKLNKDKDSLKRMCTNIIVFDDEFGGEAHKENKAFKAIADKADITMRLPYGKVDLKMPRICLLCGTSNEMDILKDTTGNRRIIPINIISINLEKLKQIDKEELIKQAYKLLQNDFEWVIRTQEDMNEIADYAKDNQEINPETEILLEYFKTEYEPKLVETVVNRGQMLQTIQNIHKGIKFSKFHIKEWQQLTKSCYQNVRLNGVVKKGFRVFTPDFSTLNNNWGSKNQDEKEEEMPF